jgi:putative toxin-antitoxin system antitoxin component (TIGR02293 family)
MISEREADFAKIAALLGGARILRNPPANSLEAHEMLSHGLPGRALDHLLRALLVMRVGDGALEHALGLSLRTLQRHRSAPSRTLGTEQGGRIWKFAEILAKATKVFGDQTEAEQWLGRPAVGLNQNRPIDLLSTPAGAKLVEDFLERLEYGVYT